jgi:hypothetical protein
LGRFVADAEPPISPLTFSWPRTLLMVLVPVLYALTSGSPLRLPSEQYTNASLDALRWLVNYAGREGGEVLFISQTHLLYFDDQIDVPLIPGYEKVFFMEMVMSKNQAYLNQFYTDIEAQRYAAIVNDRTLDYYKDRQENWPEEHNAWARFVSKPLLCYYQPRLTLKKVDVQILYPAPNPTDCPVMEKNQRILAGETP